jgi:hypothetical protein
LQELQNPEWMTITKDSDEEAVNSNEIISDYHFNLQLLWEEKELDFES